LFAFAGDHFVIRDWPQRVTIAGGVILDTNVTRAGFRSQSEQNFLATRAQAMHCAKSWLLAEIERSKVVRRKTVLLMTRFSQQEILEAIEAIIGDNIALRFDNLIVEKAWWEALLDRARKLIKQGHIDHPEEKGLKLTELKQLIPKAQLTDHLFSVVVSHLCEGGFARQDSLIMATSHLPSLPRRLQQASEKLQSTLRNRPLDPPSKEELATDKFSQEALHFLIQTGEVVEISKKLVISVAAFAHAKDTITAFLQRQGSASTSEIRRELGTTRRIAIPLLEMLDRNGITRREGLQRMLPGHLQDP